MSKLREFWQMYRLYRKASHGRVYSARIAYGIAFNGSAF